jgi:hypothetical protein
MAAPRRYVIRLDVEVCDQESRAHLGEPDTSRRAATS